MSQLFFSLLRRPGWRRSNQGWESRRRQQLCFRSSRRGSTARHVAHSTAHMATAQAQVKANRLAFASADSKAGNSTGARTHSHYANAPPRAHAAHTAHAHAPARTHARTKTRGCYRARAKGMEARRSKYEHADACVDSQGHGHMLTLICRLRKSEKQSHTERADARMRRTPRKTTCTHCCVPTHANVRAVCVRNGLVFPPLPAPPLVLPASRVFPAFSYALSLASGSCDVVRQVTLMQPRPVFVQGAFSGHARKVASAPPPGNRGRGVGTTQGAPTSP